MKKTILALIFMLIALYISQSWVLEAMTTTEPIELVTNFFGTLCVLALLALNLHKGLTQGRHLFHSLLHYPHIPRHSLP